MRYKLHYTISRPAKAIVNYKPDELYFYFDNPPQWFLDLLEGKLKVKVSKTRMSDEHAYPTLEIIFEKEKESL
jgi:hypothetical protein